MMILLLAAACNTSPNRIKPVVDIVSPPDSAQYAPGEAVSMRVAATSGNAITRVEVHTGDILVASQDNPTRSVTFSTLLQFVPVQAGSVNLVVIAIDGTGQQSDPVNLMIKIGGSSAIDNPTAGSTPLAGNGVATVVPGACKPNAAFVSDITIPDNTVVTAGSKLVKTWRLRNTGQCAWDAGYVLAFLDGESMGAPDYVTVSPTARDATVDINVPFVAPNSSGTYTSTWRMRSPNSAMFGNRVYVLIRIP
jgi:hypothetical protein